MPSRTKKSKSRRLRRREIWVVKAGSQMVVEGGTLLIREWMTQANKLTQKSNVDIVWVTSGAIATARLTMKHKSEKLIEKQAMSAIGQPIVLDQYSLAMQTQGRRVAQVLLTADDLRHRERRKNLISTLKTLLAWGVLPILNENDAVSNAEIQFGDNDHLSALVAKHLGADKLVLLTDVEGLFEQDPKRYPNSKLIRRLHTIPAKLLRTVSSRSPSGRGKGGMLSKLLAAKIAAKHGIITHLVKGDTPHALLRLAEDRKLNANLDLTPGTTIGAFP